MGNIKSMMNSQINRWGINVLVVKSSSKLKCKCYNNTTNEGNNSCSICFGVGYVSSIKKEKIIIDYGNRINNYSTPSQYGYINNQLIYAYGNSTVNINDGDKIIIVGWNKQNVISDVKEILTVGSINPYRMENGRIEGVSMACVSSNELLSKYSRYINSLSCRTRKIVSEGGVYICPS